MVCFRFINNLIVLALLAIALGGCAMRTTQPEKHGLDYQSRAISRSEGGVRVSTSVLSAEESLEVYGVPLASRRIQPVWIEVENREDVAYWLMSPGLDPHFFPPTEAADAFASAAKQEELDQAFKLMPFTIRCLLVRRFPDSC